MIEARAAPPTESSFHAFMASPYLPILLNALPAAAYTCGADGLITSCNDLAVRVWGREPKLNDPADRYCGSFRLFTPAGEPVPHEKCWMALALRENRSFHGCEIVVECENAVRRHVLAYASPFHDAHGEVCGAINILVDISERTRIARELEAARDVAQRASEAKSRFLATMSHEVRTPMNGVLGMAAVLAHTGLNADQAHIVRVIRESGDALMSVLDSVLDIAKIEAGRVEVEAIRFEPSAITRQLESLYALKAQDKGLEFHVETAEGGSAARLGDPTRLLQILHNLISNAIKFTATGEVAVTVSGDAQELVYEVCDTGLGMTAEQCARAFEPFVQADAATTRKYGGAGLGLSIVKGLVDALGGDIAVTSTPDVGTTFTVRLPFPAAPRLAYRETPAAADVRALAQQRAPRILVVDDNAANRFIMRALLEALGAEVVKAANGRSALDLFARGAFDLVFLDVHMPSMDGEETLRRLRAFEAARDRRTPVYALTADVADDRLRRYADLGFDGCIPKPVKPEKLYATLSAALSMQETDAA